jgi:hypothetical protein
VAVEGTHTQQRLQQLRQRVAELQARGAPQQQLQRAVVVDADKQAEFAATAQAPGVSLSAAAALLRVVLGDATPSLAARDASANRPPAGPAPCWKSWMSTAAGGGQGCSVMSCVCAPSRTV